MKTHWLGFLALLILAPAFFGFFSWAKPTDKKPLVAVDTLTSAGTYNEQEWAETLAALEKEVENFGDEKTAVEIQFIIDLAREGRRLGKADGLAQCMARDLAERRALIQP